MNGVRAFTVFERINNANTPAIHTILKRMSCQR